jgi:Zn finger protein HypA/HybF involved in hydrogenase expression
MAFPKCKKCHCCGEDIYNKSKNAIYCKKCGKEILLIKEHASPYFSKIYSMVRRVHPEYRIIIKVKVVKK